MSDSTHQAVPNRLSREFEVANLNRVWAVDVTYYWAREVWFYLAVAIDLCPAAWWDGRIEHTLVLEA